MKACQQIYRSIHLHCEQTYVIVISYQVNGCDVRMTINQRIKQVRQELKLSQAKFATAISISNGYIAGIELGNRKVNERIVKLVCSVFHVSESWLKTGKGEMFEKETNGKVDMAQTMFKGLNPEFQDYVLKQIEALLEIQEKQKQDNN